MDDHVSLLGELFAAAFEVTFEPLRHFRLQQIVIRELGYMCKEMAF